MARPLRIDFPGAFHHVMNRGADHQDTYRNRLDKALFLTLWEQATSRFGIEVISYALMGNHYHVFVHCPDGQLSRTMQYIGRAYTQEFNLHHDRDGALFRGRFHSVLVDSEMYFARVARYIELNPVAAGICAMDELRRYEWSSYRYSSGEVDSPYWLSTRHLRTRFTQIDYRDFVEAGAPDDRLKKFYDRSRKTRNILGSPAFVERISKSHPNIPVMDGCAIESPTLPEIEAAVIEVAGVSYRTIAVPSRLRHPARTTVIILCSLLTDEPRALLADRFGFSSASSFVKAVTQAKTAPVAEEVATLQAQVLERLRNRG